MIGVFDSGVGGLSVLSEIRALMPRADLVYVADQARAPYGTRTLEEVAEISLGIARWLVNEGAGTIVLACNTASAAALQRMRAEFTQLPIVGMEPAVKPAAAVTSTGVVGVFATAATFQGRLFESVVNTHATGVKVVEITCPDWVELVEAGDWDGAEATAAVGGPVSKARDEGADTIVLGCTHFAYLKPIISQAAGTESALIDPGPAVAAQTARVAKPVEGTGATTILTTGDSERLNSLLRKIGIIESSGSALPLSL